MRRGRGPYALLRLFVRPAALWVLFPLFWAVVIPFMRLGEAGVPPSALLAGADSAAARVAAWHLAVLVGGLLGLAVSLARWELLAAHFARTLPDLDRGLLAGAIVVGVPIAAGGAVLAARTAPPGLEGPMAAAGFTVALLWFAAGWCGNDVGLPGVVRWPGLVLLGIAAFRPGDLVRLVEWSPVGVALVAAVWAALLLGASATRAATRRRRVGWAATAPGGGMAHFWTRWRTTRKPWRHDLATARLGPWLRAAAFETSLGRGAMIPSLYVFMGSLGVLFGHVAHAPAMAFITVGIGLQGGLLRGAFTSDLPGPLSRARRADLVTVSAMIEAAALLVGSLIALGAIMLIGLPPLDWFDDGPVTIGWSAVFAMIVAWAPFIQWSGVVWPTLPGSGTKHGPKTMFLIIYLVGTQMVARRMTGVDPVILASGSAGVALLGYAVFWAAMRRRFARIDLVRRPA